MHKEWIIKGKENCSGSFIERLLATRGIVKEQDIKDFLNPLQTKLSSPNSFVDMQKATERLVKAIDEKEKIVIYGDFDADGVTSTSLLYRTFTYLGADVNYFIPDREKEGHGLDTKALVKIMTTVKPKVVITVDCGVSNVEAVNFLNSFKIDVIITDHHEAPEELPKALAIINPKAPNALDESLSAKEIDSRFNDILEFSELQEFIDNPVRTYSSGQYMRLAFSIAINVDAEILLIDEILAVGDQHFQDKCFNKLQELKNSDKTIVIVTHSLESVKKLCNRAVWIYNGEVRMDGNAKEVVDEYLKICG